MDEIAVNDDYFSSDSMIELELAQGNYIIGVSASGNSDYDPVSATAVWVDDRKVAISFEWIFHPQLINRDLMLDSTGNGIRW